MKKHNQPHKFAKLLLSYILSKENRESIVGDFDEFYHEIAIEEGISKAKLWYWIQIAKSLPSFIYSIFYGSVIMLKNYFKIAFRSLIKNKLPSGINILGLSTAIGASIVSFLFMDLHYNKDSFHDTADNIFLVQHRVAIKNGFQTWGSSPVPMGPALKTDFPQVERAVRVATSSGIVRYENNVFDERIHFVDSDFLEMFNFPLKFGQKEALLDRSAVILEHDIAIKYFGNENPIGKQVSIIFNEEKELFIVKGVTEKIPKNSSFRFGFLIAYAKQLDLGVDLTDWQRLTLATFIKLKNPSDIDLVTLNRQRYLDIQNAANPDRPMADFVFEPLLTMSQNSHKVIGGITFVALYPGQVYCLFFTGLFLLLLACFNYMNISVVSATRRLKEICVRKVMGSQRHELVKQFLAENLILCFLALVLGVILGEFFFVPGFNHLFGVFDLEMDLVGNARLWIFLVSLLVLTGVVAAAYPAFYISSFQPLDILRSKSLRGGKTYFTKTLLTFQFILSFVSLVGRFAFIQNNEYQHNRDWGYEQAQVVVVPLSNETQFTQFKNSAQQHANIMMTAGAKNHIARSIARTTIEILENKYEVADFGVGFNYFETMGLRLEQGRIFQRERQLDARESILVNQSFVNMIDWQEPIGQQILIASKKYLWLASLKIFIISHL